MNKLTNEIKKLSNEIHELLKENEAVKEYNKLCDFLENDNYFNERKSKLKEIKKLLQQNINYTENRDTFLKIRDELNSYPPYNNYLVLKEELNNLFNEISNLLTFK